MSRTWSHRRSESHRQTTPCSSTLILISTLRCPPKSCRPIEQNRRRISSSTLTWILILKRRSQTNQKPLAKNRPSSSLWISIWTSLSAWPWRCRIRIDRKTASAGPGLRTRRIQAAARQLRTKRISGKVWSCNSSVREHDVYLPDETAGWARSQADGSVR